MNLTLSDATRGKDAVPLQRRSMATPAAPAASVDWPDQAIEACAPEGGHSPFAGAPNAAPLARWS